MGEFSVTHLLLVGAIFLIFFGPSRLPQLGQSLGKAIRGFKDGLNEIETQAKEIHDDRPTQKAPNAAEQSVVRQTVPGTAAVPPTPDSVVTPVDAAKKPEHQS